MEERCLDTFRETLRAFHRTSLLRNNTPATMHPVHSYTAFFGEKTEYRLLKDYAVVHTTHMARTCHHKYLILLHTPAHSCCVRFHSPRLAIFFVSFKCKQMRMIKNLPCMCTDVLFSAPHFLRGRDVKNR